MSAPSKIAKQTEGEDTYLQWPIQLANRKNIVRVEMPLDDTGTKHMSDVFPSSITLQLPTVEHYIVVNTLKDRHDVNLQLGLKFPTWTPVTQDLNIDWTSLEKVLKTAAYRKGVHMVEKKIWTAHGPVNHIEGTGHIVHIWGYLRLALASGFENGEVKQLMRSVCHRIIQEMGVDLMVESPPPNSLLISRVLPVDENEFEEEHRSLDSNDYPIESEKKGFKVPDVIVYHPTLPLFLLSMECKKAHDDDDKGIIQALLQSFSHLHHQDVNFAFWVNPHEWRLMVVYKDKETKTISVWQEAKPLLQLSQCKTFNTFNVDSLLDLFKWMHKALAFQY